MQNKEGNLDTDSIDVLSNGNLFSDRQWQHVKNAPFGKLLAGVYKGVVTKAAIKKKKY